MLFAPPCSLFDYHYKILCKHCIFEWSSHMRSAEPLLNTVSIHILNQPGTSTDWRKKRWKVFIPSKVLCKLTGKSFISKFDVFIRKWCTKTERINHLYCISFQSQIFLSWKEKMTTLNTSVFWNLILQCSHPQLHCCIFDLHNAVWYLIISVLL